MQLVVGGQHVAARPVRAHLDHRAAVEPDPGADQHARAVGLGDAAAREVVMDLGGGTRPRRLDALAQRVVPVGGGGAADRGARQAAVEAVGADMGLARDRLARHPAGAVLAHRVAAVVEDAVREWVDGAGDRGDGGAVVMRSRQAVADGVVGMGKRVIGARRGLQPADRVIADQRLVQVGIDRVSASDDPARQVMEDREVVPAVETEVARGRQRDSPQVQGRGGLRPEGWG